MLPVSAPLVGLPVDEGHFDEHRQPGNRGYPGDTGPEEDVLGSRVCSL
jgi:hypothetical protein